MTKECYEEIAAAVEDVSEKPALSRIEGSDNLVTWKVYRVAGEIVRIDIKPKEKHGH